MRISLELFVGGGCTRGSACDVGAVRCWNAGKRVAVYLKRAELLDLPAAMQWSSRCIRRMVMREMLQESS